MAALRTLAIGLLAAGAALAGTLGIDITSPTGQAPSNSTGQTLGWAFSTTGPVTVTALGVWDEGSDGLSTGHPVGLWDSQGNLLASTTVAWYNSFAVASAVNPQIGQWLFTDIDDLTLDPGTYTVGAFSPSGSSDYYRYVVNAATDPSLTYQGARDTNLVSSLTDPTSAPSGFDYGFFGGNVLLDTGTPEPGTFLLLAPVAIFVLKMRRRAS